MMQTFRKQFHTGFFGGQGSGKTTFMIQQALKYYKATGKRILFGLPDDQEEKFDPVPEISENQIPNFTGIKKIILSNAVIERMRNYYLPEPTEVPTAVAKKRKFHGLFCLDDPGTWLPKYPDSFYKLISRRRQLNMDIISAFPGLKSKAPASYYGYLTHIELWQTGDSPRTLMDELAPNMQNKFLRLYNHVQSEADKNQHYHLGMVIRKIHPNEKCPAFDPGGKLFDAIAADLQRN